MDVKDRRNLIVNDYSGISADHGFLGGAFHHHHPTIAISHTHTIKNRSRKRLALFTLHHDLCMDLYFVEKCSDA